MNPSTPAIVAQGAVRRLPRPALLALCLAYTVAGFIGREPWKGADLAVFGYMLEMARGATSWLDPQLMGLRPEADGLLPYWLGAWALQAAPPWLPLALAARLPFVAMLALTLAASWYAVYYLSRGAGAQPVAFAFGGEAQPTDYARAIADGGLLALLACLGLAQLSHEVTTHLAQLCFATLVFFAAAAMATRFFVPGLAMAMGLAGLILSAAPALAMLLGAGSAMAHLLARDADASGRQRAQRAALAIGLITLAAFAMASVLDLWRWRLVLPVELLGRGGRSFGELLLWFCWPAWPLALWTLWRWRRQIMRRAPSLHLALPIWFAGVAVSAALITRPADRALLIALPALATLAAFALPTLQRSVSALIDWFTLLFFSGCAIIIWVIWFALQTGVPRQPAANALRQAPGFEAVFSLPVFLIALGATLAWAWLVHWRAGRHRAAIWKSMVLPAGGATLCWLLLMSLWMPLLDHVRSYAVVMQKIRAVVGPSPCIALLDPSRDQIAAFKVDGSFMLEPASDTGRCPWLLVNAKTYGERPARPDPARWQLQATIRRPSDKGDEWMLYHQSTP